MNPETGVPGEPVGKRGGRFAKNSDADQDGESDHEDMIGVVRDEAVEDVFEENDRFGGIGGGNQQREDKDDPDRVAKRERERQRPPESAAICCHCLSPGCDPLFFRPAGAPAGQHFARRLTDTSRTGDDGPPRSTRRHAGALFSADCREYVSFAPRGHAALPGTSFRDGSLLHFLNVVNEIVRLKWGTVPRREAQPPLEFGMPMDEVEA